MAVFNEETWREIIGKESVIHKVSHSHHKKIRKISNCFPCFQNKSGESNTNQESGRQHVKSGGLESLFFHKGRHFRNIYFFCFFSCETKEKTNNICISNTSTFLNVIYYLYMSGNNHKLQNMHT